MPHDAVPRALRLVRMAVVIVGVWAVAGAFFALQNHSIGVTQSLESELLNILIATFVSALLTPFLLYATENMPVTRTRILTPGLVQLAAALLYAIAHALIDAWGTELIDGAPLSEQEFFAIAAAVVHPHFMMAVMVVVVAHLLRARRENVWKAVREKQIESDLSRAQLQLLQAQMQPHFLFNTLNAAAALLATDRERAATTVFTLAELLRTSHDLGRQTSIPVSSEVAFLESYLTLQKVRFPDRLTSRIVVDPAAREALVPSLILQPLVENAILHGVTGRAAGGSVLVTIQRQGDRLHMEVRDDGPGAAPHELTNGRGLGVANTRSRLECLFKKDFALRFYRASDAFVAALTIPAK